MPGDGRDALRVRLHHRVAATRFIAQGRRYVRQTAASGEISITEKRGEAILLSLTAVGPNIWMIRRLPAASLAKTEKRFRRIGMKTCDPF
jgi:hypothetical protein